VDDPGSDALGDRAKEEEEEEEEGHLIWSISFRVFVIVHYHFPMTLLLFM